MPPTGDVRRTVRRGARCRRLKDEIESKLQDWLSIRNASVKDACPARGRWLCGRGRVSLRENGRGACHIPATICELPIEEVPIDARVTCLL
jgi:hypothetical protein